VANAARAYRRPTRHAGAQGDPRDAVLRSRTRNLLRSLSRPLACAVRLAPALFHASFAWGELRDAPPGIEGLMPRRRWGDLARDLGLPPPKKGPRGARLVSALFVSAVGPGLEFLVVPVTPMDVEARTRLETRAAIVAHALAVAGPVTVQVLHGPVDHRALPLCRLALFGCLLAGRPPESFWAPASAVAGARLPGALVGELTRSAPTPLSVLLTLLLAAEAHLVPAEVLRRATAQAHGAFTAADPELLLALWATWDTAHGAAALRALKCGGLLPCARALANGLAADSAYGQGVTPFPENLLRAGPVLTLGRRLALAAARSVRKVPLPERALLSEALRREVLETGMPRALLPALGRALSSANSTDNPAGAALFERRKAHIRELRDASGACLGRGASAEQARLRALALITAAHGKAPLTSKPARLWDRVAARLAKPVTRRTVVAVAFASRAGAAWVPLARVLFVLLRPGTRPGSQALGAGAAVERLLLETNRGSIIETIAATGQSEPAAAWLTRLVRQGGDAKRAKLPFALQLGETVLLPADGPKHLRRFPAKRFALRPRACVFSSAAEGATNGPPAPSGRLRRHPVIECQVSRLGEAQAAIVYVDEVGQRLREVIPIEHLADHLTETQALLRTKSPALLMLRPTAEVAAIAGHRLGLDLPTVTLELHGELPWKMVLVIGADRFGRGEPMGYRAAAQVVLSSWQPGVLGRIAVSSVQVWLNGAPPSPMARLYARSMVLRRLWAHVAHEAKA
jgi:hypothetical protein